MVLAQALPAGVGLAASASHACWRSIIGPFSSTTAFSTNPSPLSDTPALPLVQIARPSEKPSCPARRSFRNVRLTSHGAHHHDARRARRVPAAVGAQARGAQQQQQRRRGEGADAGAPVHGAALARARRPRARRRQAAADGGGRDDAARVHRRGPAARGAAEDAHAHGQGAAVQHQGLRPEPGRRAERGRVRGGPRRDGHRARHRPVLHVRAPHGAVHGQGAHRLHPQRQGAGAQQAGQSQRGLLAPPAGAGAAHQADRQRHHGRHRAQGRGRGHRGHAHVHGHARRREERRQHRHQQRAGRVQERPAHAQRVHVAHPQQEIKDDSAGMSQRRVLCSAECNQRRRGRETQ
ncbi:hypothetical protein ON010_g16997 [Phytophthora cinnamomi]|nr:hypothetical protein ON010_g16997 [Phytophthora cinnamomi]